MLERDLVCRGEGDRESRSTNVAGSDPKIVQKGV